MRERLFHRNRFAIDREHRRQRDTGVRAFGGVILQPIYEPDGFPGKTEPDKSIDREGSVAYPRETIVPIARTADHFRQAGCGCGDDRAGGLKREQL